MVIECLFQVFNIKTISVGDASKSHATDLRNSIKMETIVYTVAKGFQHPKWLYSKTSDT